MYVMLEDKFLKTSNTLNQYVASKNTFDPAVILMDLASRSGSTPEDVLKIYNELVDRFLQGDSALNHLVEKGLNHILQYLLQEDYSKPIKNPEYSTSLFKRIAEKIKPGTKVKEIRSGITLFTTTFGLFKYEVVSYPGDIYTIPLVDRYGFTSFQWFTRERNDLLFVRHDKAPDLNYKIADFSWENLRKAIQYAKNNEKVLTVFLRHSEREMLNVFHPFVDNNRLKQFIDMYPDCKIVIPEVVDYSLNYDVVNSTKQFLEENLPILHKFVKSKVKINHNEKVIKQCPVVKELKRILNLPVITVDDEKISAENMLVLTQAVVFGPFTFPMFNCVAASSTAGTWVIHPHNNVLCMTGGGQICYGSEKVRNPVILRFANMDNNTFKAVPKPELCRAFIEVKT